MVKTLAVLVFPAVIGGAIEIAGNIDRERSLWGGAVAIGPWEAVQHMLSGRSGTDALA